MESFSKITDSTKGFAKNPLGIIALFISLIYGFACLVLSTASSNLETNERMPLIWFLVIFPIIIMLFFLFLVTKHHKKLYGPSDYKDERIFLETMDIKSQKDTLRQTIESATYNEQSKSKYQELKNEKLKGFLISENLSLRLLEKEYKSPLRRNVRFKGHKDSFDGIIETNEEFVGIEIKYFDKLEDEFFEPIALHYKRKLHSFIRVARQFSPNKKYLLELIIVSNEDITEFKKLLDNILKHEQSINTRYIKYSELKQQFGIVE